MKKLTYAVSWGKTGERTFVDSDNLDEAVLDLIDQGATIEEIVIAVDTVPTQA